MIKIGTYCECAAWFNPANPKAHDGTKNALVVSMAVLQSQNDVVFGEFTWMILQPGDDRVPDPPADAPNGIELMLVEAQVVENKMPLENASFITDLAFSDLTMLRELTRRSAAHVGQRLTDSECDAIIEHIGPKMAEQVLSTAILN